MRLQILSDLHLECGAFTPPKVNVDVVIIAGDTGNGVQGLQWAMKTLANRPVIFLAGNHDFYWGHVEKLTEEFRKLAKDSNVHFLENNSVCIGDVVFLGATLWTDFALNGDVTVAKFYAHIGMGDYFWVHTDQEPRLLEPRDTLLWHQRSMRWLQEQVALHEGKKLVIVTHHAPSPESISPNFKASRLNPAFVSDLNSFITQSQARLWIHGHVHQACSYKLGKTRVIANPRGYSDDPKNGFRPDLVVNV